MRTLRINETKLNAENAVIGNLFALGGLGIMLKSVAEIVLVSTIFLARSC